MIVVLPFGFCFKSSTRDPAALAMQTKDWQLLFAAGIHTFG
jgi:hypothetical protein